MKAELLNHNPLFPARNEMELFEGIINTIGSPNETIWPGFSKLPIFKSYNLKEIHYKLSILDIIPLIQYQ